MDTPRPDQIRRAQPEAAAAGDEDSLELMEMILGALGGWGRGWRGLGREALGPIHMTLRVAALPLPPAMGAPATHHQPP